MGAKLDKVEKEIEKVKKRIATAAETLNSLEDQRDELEKIELVHALRSMKIKPSELKTYLEAMRNQTGVSEPRPMIMETTVQASIVQKPGTTQNPEIIYQEAEDEE